MGIDETARVQARYDRQAGIYDLKEAPMEWLVKGLRRRLWGEVKGAAVLEVGVGTGKNLPNHPEDARVIAMDISPRMLRRAASRARRLGRHVDLVVADAQQLPFRDGAFDAAADTFVFCSVPDPVAGLQEVRRVVRDGGRVHLLEHVRARGRLVGRLMDLLNPIAVRLSGANINRDTVSNVARAGIALDSVESRGFGIVKLMRGSAGPSAAAIAAEEAKTHVARG
ncbi:MAG: class I SAM-dependent methyltransferase [Chloroflexi bacterium]|nr:class I SAM-dependent methyltransferase [Chloroflexota bacterium]